MSARCQVPYARLTAACFIAALESFAGVIVAAEPPSVVQLRESHERLREASVNVEGRFHVYRSETLVPQAFDRPPSELEIPLVRSGYLWRRGDEIRADFISYNDGRSGVPMKTQHSVAISNGEVYQFSGGSGRGYGVLTVYDARAPQAASVLRSITSSFFNSIDSLWSKDGTAFVDLLQRNDARVLSTSRVLSDAFSVIVSPEGGASETRFEFVSAADYPFGFGSFAAEESGVRVRAEQRVHFVDVEGLVLPTRVVNASEVGSDKAYTKVVTLELQPLKAGSPLEGGLSSSAFQDLDGGYQVHRVGRGGDEQPAERYEGSAQSLPSTPASGFRAGLLWLSGLGVLIFVGVFILYKARLAKQK